MVRRFKKTVSSQKTALQYLGTPGTPKPRYPEVNSVSRTLANHDFPVSQIQEVATPRVLDTWELQLPSVLDTRELVFFRLFPNFKPLPLILNNHISKNCQNLQFTVQINLIEVIKNAPNLNIYVAPPSDTGESF